MSHSNISSGLQCQQGDQEPPCPDLGFQFGHLLTVPASELRDLFPESSSSYDSSSSFDLTGAQQKEAEDDDDDDDVGDSEEMWSADSSKMKKPRLLGGLSAVDDNDDDKNEEDGFRTPTGPEHRIPESKECPSRPPPRAGRRRRVPVVSKARRRIQLDLWKDFPSLPSSSSSSSCCCKGVYGDDNRRNKRARTDCSSSN